MEPTVETTEEQHLHYCDLCGGIWLHADDLCEGPRLHGWRIDNYFDCPMCVDRETER